MGDFTIFHNPRCSKSRQTLKLLEDEGIQPRIVEYLKNPPDADSLKALIGKLGIDPANLLRKKEAEFKSLSIDVDDEEAVISAMVKFPVLIERPIVVKGDRAVIGRPPENVRKLFKA